MTFLQKLHQTLKDQRPHIAETIDQWAYDHADQARTLARTIVEGLSVWPHVLDILQHLCHAATFRVALLTSHPQLLNQLLHKANHSQHDFDCLSQLCVLVLSDPLPASVPLPASSQDFLWRVFEVAVKHPTTEHLESVYLILDGQPELLEILPQAGIERLRKHLIKMMSHGKTIEDKILTLYSLAIMATIAGRYRKMAEHWAADVSTKQLLAETEPLFVGDRAARTLHLVVLQVILACRHDSIKTEDAVKRVRLATQVIEAMDECTLRAWVSSNPNPINKLHEKMGQRGLHPRVQLEAIGFATVLVGELDVGSAAVERLHALLLRPSMEIGSRTAREAVEAATAKVIGRFEESMWSSCFSEICSRPAQSSSESSSMSRRHGLCLVDCLRKALGKQPSATVSACRALSEPEMQQKVSTFFRHRSDRSICAFVLELLVAQPSTKANTNAALVSQLIRKLEDTGAMIAVPQQALPPNQATDPITLIEPASTPEANGMSHHWRQRLASELGLEAKHRHHTVIQLVSRACEDLERRCEDVEQPLRAEQARSEVLMAQNEALKRTVEGLESRQSELNDRADAAHQHRVEAELRADGTESDLVALQSRCGDLQRELEQANADAARVLESTRHAFEQQVLELQSSAACQNEKVDEYSVQLRDVEQQLQQKNDDLQRLREEHKSELEAVTADLSHTQEALHEQSRKLKETGGQLHASRELEASLRNELTQSSNALDAVATKYDELIEEKKHVADCFDREREASQEKHRYEVDRLEVAAKETEAQAEHELHEYREAISELEATVRDRDHIIEELQAQVQDYDAELQEKSMQLNEALGLKSNLLSLLNGGGGAALTKQAESKPKGPSPVKLKTVNRRRSRADQKAVATPSRRAETLQVPIPSSTFDGAQDSQSPTSPSPKRTKGQTSFRIPSTKHTTFALPTQSAKLIRSRRSLGLPALGESSASRLNGNRDRRRTDFPASWKADLASETKSSSGPTHDENMSEDVTPVSKQRSPSG